MTSLLLLLSSAAQIVAVETVVPDKDDDDIGKSSSFVLADRAAALSPPEQHRLEQLLLRPLDFDIGIDTDIEAVLLGEDISTSNDDNDKSFETASDNQSSDGKSVHHSSRRNLQPALLVAACAAPEDDPKAEFHTTTGRGLRRCQWLAASSSRITAECSTAEAVSRLGVIAVTEADWTCPHTCGKCGGYGGNGEDIALPVDGMDADLVEALGLVDGAEEEQADIDIDDLGLSDIIVAIEPNADDDDAEDSDIIVDKEPPIQPYQQIKIDVLDPSGAGLADDPVLGILPRRHRTWLDAAATTLAPDKLAPLDPMQAREAVVAIERDPFMFTEMPSAMPSSSPSDMPTSLPSASPTGKPWRTDFYFRFLNCLYCYNNSHSTFLRWENECKCSHAIGTSKCQPHGSAQHLAHRQPHGSAQYLAGPDSRPVARGGREGPVLQLQIIGQQGREELGQRPGCTRVEVLETI